MKIPDNELAPLCERMKLAGQCAAALRNGSYSAVKQNNLLDSLCFQLEHACLDARRTAERNREASGMMESKPEIELSPPYGEVEITPEGWIRLALNFPLPGRSFLSGTQYITDCVRRLLEQKREILPFFASAFTAVVEHSGPGIRGPFDHDNKPFQSIINALKGMVFPDDNQLQMSLGLFSFPDGKEQCEVFILPLSQAPAFLNFHLETLSALSYPPGFPGR